MRAIPPATASPAPVNRPHTVPAPCPDRKESIDVSRFAFPNSTPNAPPKHLPTCIEARHERQAVRLNRTNYIVTWLCNGADGSYPAANFKALNYSILDGHEATNVGILIEKK